ncbi:MAG: NUDIX domain-containing protein [Methylobacteriaceae bacterium]|jgi:predicted NUDIX family phosphoesterase|nr:NUDIX domain-containing protein [Methylobacteriaceae bacterium]
MRICCVDTHALPDRWISRTTFTSEDFFTVVGPGPVRWLERAGAETDTSHRQLIPYVLVRDAGGAYLCYQRHGSEKRLTGLYSVGLGGHIEENDARPDLRQTVHACILRELAEELADFDPLRITLDYRGVINEIETPVGLVHLGLVHLARCAPGYRPLPGAEISGAQWKSAAELAGLRRELWSDLALRLMDRPGHTGAVREKPSGVKA